MTAISHQYRLPEFGTAALLSLAVTSMLFLLMYTLIATEIPELDESPTYRFDPVMVPPKPPKTELEPPPEAIPDPQPQPVMELTNAQVDFDTDSIVGFGDPSPIIDQVTPGASLGDSGIVPIFRVQPDYPRTALNRGIEGYVDLLFDVTASGKTENIRVIDANPSGVFERAAIRALKKWKYKPPLQDNIPYAQPNMTTRISFALET